MNPSIVNFEVGTTVLIHEPCTMLHRWCKPNDYMLSTMATLLVHILPLIEIYLDAQVRIA